MADANSVYKTIVADDSPDDLELVMVVLREHPEFRVVLKAMNGAEVIAYLRGDAPFNDRSRFPYPDLLLCDLKMSGMDGFQVLEWIKANSLPRFVIVMMTGSEDPEDITRGLALGADRVCVKPVSLEYLRDAAYRLKDFMETHHKEACQETS